MMHGIISSKKSEVCQQHFRCIAEGQIIEKKGNCLAYKNYIIASLHNLHYHDGLTTINFQGQTLINPNLVLIKEFNIAFMLQPSFCQVETCRQLNDITIGQQCFIRHIDPSKDTFDPINTDALVSSISLNYVSSCLVPQLPLIEVGFDEGQNIDGLCGSILCDINGSIGMIIKNDIQKKNLYALPFIIVEKIIESVVQKNALYGIMIHSSICDVCENEEDTETTTGYLVTETTCPYINGRKTYRMQKNDVIVEVNGVKINRHGLIKIEEINFDVPLNTYLFFVLLDNNTVNIKFFRDNKTKNVTLSGILYNNIFVTKIYNEIVVAKKNVYISEMTEFCLVYLKDKIGGKELKSILNHYNDFSQNNEKIYVKFQISSDDNKIQIINVAKKTLKQ